MGGEAGGHSRRKEFCLIFIFQPLTQRKRERCDVLNVGDLVLLNENSSCVETVTTVFFSSPE